MTEQSPVVAAARQLIALDQGLDGFKQLFHAISSNIRAELAQAEQTGLSFGVPAAAPSPGSSTDEHEKLVRAEGHVVKLRTELGKLREELAARSRPDTRLADAEEHIRNLKGEIHKLQDHAAAAAGDSAKLATAHEHIRALEAEAQQLRDQLAAAAEGTPPTGTPVQPAPAPAAAAPATGGGGELWSSFLGGIANRLEQVVGPAAKGMAFTGGKAAGEKLAAGATKTTSLAQGLAEVRRVFAAHHVDWQFTSPLEADPAALDTLGAAGKGEVPLSFTACPVRPVLAEHGLKQGESLCYMMCGLFSGAFESVTGRKCKLEIGDAGADCCSEKLKVM
ncbi:MAG: hypothetical protein HY903_04305 [Deltaproteobacteria bacterium]|nr:hypothetical protein [Deltaproteobacteria bacterium]